MDPVLSFFCDSMLIYAGPDACSYFFLSTVTYREQKRITLSTRNDLIVPRLPQLLSQRGRFLVVGDDATFVSTFLGKEYHLEQRALHSWRMTRRMMDYSVLSSE